MRKYFIMLTGLITATLLMISGYKPAEALAVGSISGTVVSDSTGLPLEGAMVQLYQGVDENIADEQAWDWVAMTQTDASGHYEFTNLEPRRYHIDVYSQNISGINYLDADLYNVQVLDGATTTDMDFSIRLAGVIYGYVKTSGGLPIPNAEVVAEGAWTNNADEWHTQWTDETGRYEIFLEPSPGAFYPVWVRNAFIPGTTYEVYGGNDPIMGGEQGNDPMTYGYTLLGTGTGDKTFAGGPYNYYVVVAREGYVVKLDAVQFSDQSYGFPAGSFNTRDEFNSHGQPDTYYAIVNAFPGQGGGGILFMPQSATTDITVYIVEDDRGADPFYYETKWDGNFYRATIGGTQGPDYLLEQAGVIKGRVVNETGTGIANVQVQLAWNGKGYNGRATETWANTDMNGYFILGGIPSEESYVRLCTNWQEVQQGGVKYSAGEAYLGPINVTAGTTVDAGIFKLYQTGMISGIVTSEDGLPVVDVEVQLEGRDRDGNPVWKEDQDIITDSFGQYTVDYVPPGNYYMVFQKEGFITKTIRNILVYSGDDKDIDVIIQSYGTGAVISGNITNYLDVAPHDANNILIPSYEEESFSEFGLPEFGIMALSMEEEFTKNHYLNIDSFFIGQIDQSGIEDGYGDYFVEDANETPGTYSMALPPGDIAIGMFIYRDTQPGEGGYAILHDWKRFNLSQGDMREDVNFTAITSNTGTLKGDITVPEGYGKLSEGWCAIYAFNELNSTAVALGDAVAFPGWTAAYVFENLPAGTYTLRGYARGLATVFYSSVTVTAGQTTIQNIEFSAGGTLTGQVTDGTKAVAGALVTIVENGIQTLTNASGEYAISGLDEGSYTVRVRASGFADYEADVSIISGSETIQDAILDSNVGSISGTVKDSLGANINGATVVAYNETDKSSRTAVTVSGAFQIGQLTPGNYILAANTPEHGVLVYPADTSRIAIAANEDKTGIAIPAVAIQPPAFTVNSSVSGDTTKVLSMEFYSDKDLSADPLITKAQGLGALGTMTVNAARNRFNIIYTADSADTIVSINIAETVPLVSGSPSSKAFTFEVSAQLIQTTSTNVTNALGGTASIMGTQDNTKVYVPPFAIAGADASEAVTLTIERYGDPGDPVKGTTDTSASAVYDFSFDEEGVSIDVNHTFTVTMSFILPTGMTQAEFESTLQVRYFDAGDQQWKTDGISNVRINWTNLTIMFDVSHLTEFAAFLSPPGMELGGNWNLISLEKQPANTAIATVLDAIIDNVVSVWAYTGTVWEVYDPANPSFSDLLTMEAGKGYWINMNETATLTVSGSAPSKSIDLVSGWNLVGYNSSAAQDIATALASIANKYISVWAYMGGSWKVYDPANPGFSDLTSMEPGYGYWINANQDCIWTLP